MTARWMLVVAAFGGAAACGGNVVVDGAGGQTGVGGQTGSQGSGGTLGVSCDVHESGIHVCEEVDNPTPAALSSVQTSCASTGGTLGTACPSANRLGTCVESSAGITATQSFYNGGGLTGFEAQMACTSAGGTWTAG